VEDAFEVFITFSNSTESIEVEANDNLHDYIEIENFNGRLEIGLQRGVNIRGNAHLRVNITTKNVHTYDISGASFVKLESPWSGSNLDVFVSGASSFDGKIDAGKASINLSGASSTDLGGTVRNLHSTLSGASRLDDYDLVIQNLEMDLSGASSARLTVQESIMLEASGASTLHYKGDAVIEKIELSGASNIKRG
jgi:hypothetical protein